MRRAFVGLFALTLGVMACDSAFGPGRSQVALVLQPRFAELEEHEAVDDNPALKVDNVRVLVIDEADDTVVDKIAEWPLDQDTLQLEVAIEVTSEGETFQLQLQGREDDTILFQTEMVELELSSSDTEPQAMQPVLEYAGPEATLAVVAISGPPEAFLAGDEVQLGAVGVTDDDEEVTDPLMVWSSLDTLAATVDTAGTVSVKHDASRTARIVGRVAFRTLADTLVLPVAPASLNLAQRPDTIRSIGWPQLVWSTPLGVNGDTVRNVTVDWTLRDSTVIRFGEETNRTTSVRVVGRTNGQAHAVGTAGPTTDSVLVTVDQAVAALAPKPTHAVLAIGDTFSATISAVDSGGTPVADADSPSWSSGNTSVALVDQVTGLVTAANAPQPVSGVGITGQIDSVSYDIWVEVVQPGVGATRQISVGDSHTCRLDSVGGALWCRGINESGQLGNGTTTDQDTAVQVVNLTGDPFAEVSAGGLHTCALMDTTGGTQPYCWGDNRFGQLGDGSITNRSQPVPVTDASVPGDFVSLAAGGVHTCGLTDAGAAYCWGYNLFGQLGDGGATGFAFSPTAVVGGHTFTDLAAGWLHTCGLRDDGTVWCWGRGGEGQLGADTLFDSTSPVQVADSSQTFTHIEAGAAHTCGLTPAGDVMCWGYNSSGQVGVGVRDFTIASPTTLTFPSAVTATDLALGWIFGCALASDGAVYCWGANDQLQLGQAVPRAARSPILAPIGFTPTSIEGGGGEACGIDGTRTICWGGIPSDYILEVIPTDSVSGLVGQ